MLIIVNAVRNCLDGPRLKKDREVQSSNDCLMVCEFVYELVRIQSI